jgi:ubiquinone/menaquinone biosynthesis C-methylase UbiE
MGTITSKDYDSRIVAQGLQFQIDNYYIPKDAAMRRRIEVVTTAIEPKAGEKILDIGCGVGTFAYRCAKAGARTIAIDYSLESIKAARTLGEKFGVSQSAAYLVADGANLPFKDGYFDKVVAADFVEHITLEDKRSMLCEIRRVLKRGGRAVIFTPNGIREKIGDVYRKARHVFFGEKIPTTDLHFGLTTRREFERLCKEAGFAFTTYYTDTTRPYLAKIPLVRNILALNLSWVHRKEAR